MNSPMRTRARDAYATALAQRGPAYANIANSVRGGFENMWVTPALDAIEQALRRCVDDDEDRSA